MGSSLQTFTREFTPREWARIWRAASERLNPKIEAGVDDRYQIDKAKHHASHQLGIAAELAVFELLGLDPAPIWKCHGFAGDGGTDAILEDGRTVSIKAAKSRNAGLIFPPSHPFTEDLAVFATCFMFNGVWIRGYVSRAEYFAQCEMRDLGRGCGKQEWLAADSLFPFDELIEAQHRLIGFDF